MERTIGTVLRSVAARVARGEKYPHKLTVAHLSESLGPIKYESEMALNTQIPGVVTGMAFTPVGGVLIFIEAAKMPGRGNFTLTGQIGDVMRESAQAAMTLVRSRAKKWGVKTRDLHNHDIHIHVPAGGIPKDGPSAGVSMLTAIVSLMTDKPALASIAMTGEITLRGLVLPIGGVKEKVLGAHRAGIKKGILPSRNERDLVDVPELVRAELEFFFAKTVDEDGRAIVLTTTKEHAELKRDQIHAFGKDHLEASKGSMWSTIEASE